MAVVIDGTTGISTPAEAVAGNLSYTGTLTGGAGVINLGSGQVYKDASGRVSLGTTSVDGRVLIQEPSAGAGATFYNSSGNSAGQIGTTNEAGTSNGLEINAYRGDGKIVFKTAATERARIDSSGFLLVNCTTTPSASVGGIRLVNPAVDTCRSSVGNINTSQQHLQFLNGNGVVGSISTSGSGTAYTTSSDYRLKNTIAPMTGALAKVALLKPCTYKWKVDGSDGQGFIAHELAEVEAGCVTGEKDAVDADGNPQYQGIDTSFLIATLSAAIQELKAIVDTQAISITALNERLTALEATA